MPDSAVETMQAFVRDKKIDCAHGTSRTRLPEPPRLKFTPGVKYYWDLKTSHGDLRVRLLPDVAPMHVSNTVYLTLAGFYDGLKFHRVIPGFMAQGGCPLGTGTGGPGYQFDGEFQASARHDRPGILSMANAGPGTDGSQFFLTFVETAWLDGKHTVFGEVVSGEETLRALEKRGTRSGQPTEPVLLEKATLSTES